MSIGRGNQGGRPRTQGSEDDPLVTVNLHVRKSQLAVLDELANAGRTSRAELIRQAIDLLLIRLKRR
jgi:ribbon-helix-helix CopG family protein